MAPSSTSEPNIDPHPYSWALVNADGLMVAGSALPSAKGNWDRPLCQSLFAVHSECPCDECYIQQAFSIGEPTGGVTTHPRMGPLQVRVWPLTDRDGHSTQAILQITPDPDRFRNGPARPDTRQAFDGLPQTVFETNPLGRITFANRHARNTFGYTARDFVGGLNIMQVISPSDRERVQELFCQVLQGESGLSVECSAQTKTGEDFYAVAYALPLTENNRVVGVRGMLIDISQQKAVEHSLRQSKQRYQYFTQHDQLTGLPGRLLLMERLEQALIRAAKSRKPIAVMILDLDRFKEINASLGNDCGDLALCEIGRRLQQLVRQNDTLARLNGDEFALIYTHITKQENLSLLAQRLLDAFREPLQIAGHTVYLSASIGIASSRQDASDGETLLRQATIAMNEAKTQESRSFAFFNQEMQTCREESFLFEKHMREALKRKEFYLHYQPQIDLISGKITGVEALARWTGPEGNEPSPELFIKVAEDSGLIHALGDFLLQEACSQNLRWQQQGLPKIQVTVNISPKQFAQRGFVDKILRILKRTGLAPQWLELEITESVIMGNIQEALTTMHRLKQAGVRLAIDDFGTGHSSLNYLRQLPLSKLKIDRSFVQDIPGNRDNENLVFSILTLARSFNLQTVAEGIETQNQLDYLQQLECDLGQGYLFSKPVSAQTIPDLLCRYNT